MTEGVELQSLRQYLPTARHLPTSGCQKDVLLGGALWLSTNHCLPEEEEEDGSVETCATHSCPSLPLAPPCTSRVSGIFEKFTCRPKCLLWAHMVPWLLVARPAWCLLLVERACVCSSAPVLTSPSCPDSVSGQVPGSAETCLC